MTLMKATADYLQTKILPRISFFDGIVGSPRTCPEPGAQLLLRWDLLSPALDAVHFTDAMVDPWLLNIIVYWTTALKVEMHWSAVSIDCFHTKPNIALSSNPNILTYYLISKVIEYTISGLHNLFHPTIRDGSMWSKFGARGEHRDVFLFSFFSCLFKGSQEHSFFLQTLLFMAFLVTVLKILTYALVSTWSSVSSG